MLGNTNPQLLAIKIKMLGNVTQGLGHILWNKHGMECVMYGGDK
jgi:hypothetical protein